MTMRVEVLTAGQVVFSDEVDVIMAPGTEGCLGILPHHARMMTILEPGELIIRKGSEEFRIAVTGGYLEVCPDEVIILADAAERAEDIDVSRAEAAKLRALERLRQATSIVDKKRADASLHRALIRLKVAEQVHHQERRRA